MIKVDHGGLPNIPSRSYGAGMRVAAADAAALLRVTPRPDLRLIHGGDDAPLDPPAAP